jgi:probable rRNA maturation factor
MPPTLALTVQYATAAQDPPTEAAIRAWVTAALADRRAQAELTVRLVDEAECASLNAQYRGSTGPTNTLSFPTEGLEDLVPTLLGDVVICAPVVLLEAAAQGKIPSAHYAHLIVHSTLHLLGFDHHDPVEAEYMEAEEIAILRSLGYSDPYENHA